MAKQIMEDVNFDSYYKLKRKAKQREDRDLR